MRLHYRCVPAEFARDLGCTDRLKRTVAVLCFGGPPMSARTAQEAGDSVAVKPESEPSRQPDSATDTSPTQRDVPCKFPAEASSRPRRATGCAPCSVSATASTDSSPAVAWEPYSPGSISSCRPTLRSARAHRRANGDGLPLSARGSPGLLGAPSQPCPDHRLRSVRRALGLLGHGVSARADAGRSSVGRSHGPAARLSARERRWRGLTAIHERGIVHCDMKPRNVLFGVAGRSA